MKKSTLGLILASILALVSLVMMATGVHPAVVWMVAIATSLVIGYTLYHSEMEKEGREIPFAISRF